MMASDQSYFYDSGLLARIAPAAFKRFSPEMSVAWDRDVDQDLILAAEYEGWICEWYDSSVISNYDDPVPFRLYMRCAYSNVNVAIAYDARHRKWITFRSTGVCGTYDLVREHRNRHLDLGVD